MFDCFFLFCLYSSLPVVYSWFIWKNVLLGLWFCLVDLFADCYSQWPRWNWTNQHCIFLSLESSQKLIGLDFFVTKIRDTSGQRKKWPRCSYVQQYSQIGVFPWSKKWRSSFWLYFRSNFFNFNQLYKNCTSI